MKFGAGTYLVEKTVDGGGYNVDPALLASVFLGDSDLRLAEITKTALLNNRKDLLPISISLLIEGHAEKPIALLVS
jgi:hypothetical protein